MTLQNYPCLRSLVWQADRNWYLGVMDACMDVIPTSKINPCLPILAINLHHISLTPFTAAFTSTFSFPLI